MMVTTLIFSFFLYAFVSAIAYSSSPSKFCGFQVTGLIGLLGISASCSIVGNSLMPFLTSFLLGIWQIICFLCEISPRTFARWSSLTVLASFLCCGWLALGEVKHNQELQQQYPLVSLAERLDYETESSNLNSSSSPPKLDSKTEQRLQEVESNTRKMGHYRHHALEKIHQGSVHTFINSAGFGFGRMYRFGEWDIKRDERRFDFKLPEQLPTYAHPAEKKRPAFWNMHKESYLNFTHEASFGYVKNRQQVAGFVPHLVDELPNLNILPTEKQNEQNEKPNWTLNRLQLVSLLIFDKPKVYLSNELSNMDALDSLNVRELTRFELNGLEQLQAGEDIVITEAKQKTQMLGSLRAAKQCLQCHSVNRGELLGAFTYELQPNL